MAKKTTPKNTYPYSPRKNRVVEFEENPVRSAERVGLVNRLTAMMQAFRHDTSTPEDLVIPSQKEVLTREGFSKWNHPIFDVFGVSPSYKQAVVQCRALAENNPIFVPIIRKLQKTIGTVPTQVVFADHDTAQAAEASEIVRSMLDRVKWDAKKEAFVKKMLNEGGVSWEVVVSNIADRIDKIEYRPHDSVRRVVDDQGAFINPNVAYEQLDYQGSVVAQFALWQMIDVNLEESAFHDRGIPHLQAARQTLTYVDVMTKGLMQKWIRGSGSIEHFNVEDAKRWEDIVAFQDENHEALNARPDNLVRQIFSKGKVNLERITADDKSLDTDAIEFMMELIFLASGVAKEIFGFKGQFLIRDMVEVAIDNYFQVLDNIQDKLFMGLRKAIDFELLLHGIVPSDVPYKIIGGKFEVVRQTQITQQAVDTGAVSLNDIRRAHNLPVLSNPMWDVPGLYNDPVTARELAKAAGIEMPNLPVGEQPSEAPENGKESASKDVHTHAVEYEGQSVKTSQPVEQEGGHTHTITLNGEKIVSSKPSPDGDNHYHEFVINGQRVRSSSDPQTTSSETSDSNFGIKLDGVVNALESREKILDSVYLRTEPQPHTPVHAFLLQRRSEK